MHLEKQKFIDGGADIESQESRPYDHKKVTKILESLYKHQGHSNPVLSWEIRVAFVSRSVEGLKKKLLEQLKEAGEKQDSKSQELLKELYDFFENIDIRTLPNPDMLENKKEINGILEDLKGWDKKIIGFYYEDLLNALRQNKITEAKKILASLDLNQGKLFGNKIKRLVELLPPENLNVEKGSTARVEQNSFSSPSEPNKNNGNRPGGEFNPNIEN